MTIRPISQFLARTACIAALGGLALATTGCTRLKSQQGYVGDEALINAVQVGVDNKDSVRATLGRPTFEGQFSKNEWYYYSRNTRQLAFSKPKPTAQNVLHIRFDANGNVAQISKSGVEKIAKINPEGDKTPTLGRKTGFFEELFGNVGAVGAPGVGGGAPR